jgi:hypothetical protein
VVTVSPGFALKHVVGLLIEPQNPGDDSGFSVRASKPTATVW